MSFSLIRSRITQSPAFRTCHLPNNNKKNLICRRFSSTTYSDPSPSSPPLPPPLPSHKTNALATALKFGTSATFLGVTAVVAYATYAYTVEEVDEKTKAFRISATKTTEVDSSIINNIKSTALSAPAKAVDFYLDLRRSIEEHVRNVAEPLSDKLLCDLPPHMQHVFTLVLDLNETLVYSDWKRERGWRTFKRPGVDAFLEHLAQYYEIIVYSDNLQMYVDPVLERLDEKHAVAHRLSRAATLYQNGKHYRDLSKLNRDPKRVIYISAHALENCLQPENCVEIKPWKTDDVNGTTLPVNDTTLLDLIPFLEFVAQSGPPDIRKVLASYQGRDIAKEFIERTKEHQRRMQQKQGRSWRL